MKLNRMKINPMHIHQDSPNNSHALCKILNPNTGEMLQFTPYGKEFEDTRASCHLA